MQRFFESVEAIKGFLEHLDDMVCPFCGARGTLVRHGYIWGAISQSEYGIRAWRIFCDPDSPHGRGCGRAPSIRLSGTLMRHCYAAETLWRLILAWCSRQSVRGAWKQSGFPLSLRSAYRLFHRLKTCQSVLRTALCSRAPPPEKKSAGSPLQQALEHLRETFGCLNAVKGYQETLQKDFLAMA